MEGGSGWMPLGLLLGSIDHLQEPNHDPEGDSGGRILKIKIEKGLNEGCR